MENMNLIGFIKKKITYKRLKIKEITFNFYCLRVEL